MALHAIQENTSSLIHYPDRGCHDLREALAQRHGLKAEQILVGNGSTGLIHLLPKALKLKRVLIPVPSFSEYEAAATLAGCEIQFLRLRDEDRFIIQPAGLIKAMQQGVDALFLCNPNNPTGQLLHESELLPVIQKANEKRIRIILDETFIDYAEQASLIRARERYANLIVLRSFTKFYAMPGLRVGYLVASEGSVAHLERFKPPWSVNHLAQVAATASLKDELYIKRSRQVMQDERRYFAKALAEIPGITVFPSSANYLLLKLSEDVFRIEEAEKVLRRENVLVRNCGSFRGLSQSYLRVAVKLRPDNERLAQLLTGVSSKQMTGTSS